MKTIALVRFAALAMLVGAPVFAQASDSDIVQRCMDKFVAENFADRTASFKIEEAYAPLTQMLMSTSGTRHVRLVASNRSSGRTLAYANCTVRGEVTTLSDVIVAEPVVSRE